MLSNTNFMGGLSSFDLQAPYLGNDFELNPPLFGNQLGMPATDSSNYQPTQRAKFASGFDAFMRKNSQHSFGANSNYHQVANAQQQKASEKQ